VSLTLIHCFYSICGLLITISCHKYVLGRETTREVSRPMHRHMAGSLELAKFSIFMFCFPSFSSFLLALILSNILGSRLKGFTLGIVHKQLEGRNHSQFPLSNDGSSTCFVFPLKYGSPAISCLLVRCLHTYVHTTMHNVPRARAVT
jgi:hypothetical protein